MQIFQRIDHKAVHRFLCLFGYLKPVLLVEVKLPDPAANILITNILARKIVEGNKLDSEVLLK